MTRIGRRFSELKKLGEGGLVTFITAGDPNIETTLKIILELDKAGADVVEIGIPFSDPIADGPSIQAASMRALAQGTNIPAVLGLVQGVRRESQIPIVLMTYYNPVFHYGTERFARDAARAGADGVIVTDIIPEEAAVWKKAADDAELDTIFLLAPTSREDRIEKVANLASGFIYCISRTGITGAGTEMSLDARKLAEAVKGRTDKPVAVGFGISNRKHVQDVCSYADGAIVGSVLVDTIARYSGTKELLENVHKLVKSLKSGTLDK